MPASSLNGAINTFLSNNVVTTQITPELKSKLSYRYYDFANNTPEILFNDWIVADTTSANNRSTAYAPVHSLSVAYTKQNAGADLDWRPNHQWNLGAGYAYERYTWTRADANATNENGAKAFVDYKPVSWITTRASWTYSERRYDTYDYRGNVGMFQWADSTCQAGPTAACGSQYSAAMRQFYLSNRDRNKGQVSVAIDIIRGLTITPTFGYQDDSYQLAATELGLTRNKTIRAGADLAYAIQPGTTLMLAYMNEESDQNLRGGGGTVPPTAAQTYNVPNRDRVNTFMAAVNYAAIPDKLDLKASYTLSLSKANQPLTFDSGAGLPAPGGQYPDVKTQWQRVDLDGKYTFDKETVSRLGLKGEMYAKLRYSWEHNSVDNYDQDIMRASMMYFNSTYSRMTWLAFDNPNYDVHLIAASIGLKW
jgi:MtrB/PioB family decaheme-associated outer membrane protein